MYGPTSDSAATVKQQPPSTALPNIATSHSPSPRNPIPTTSHPAPQISSRRPDQSRNPIPPSSHDQKAGDQSSGHVPRWPSYRDIAQSKPPDPTQLDFSKPQKVQAYNRVHGHFGGAGESRTSLHNTLGGGNTSKRDVSGNDSRELSAHEFTFAVAETGLGLDLSHDSRDKDEGKYWSGAQQNHRGASRMLLS